jgi:hypothetical protein
MDSVACWFCMNGGIRWVLLVGYISYGCCTPRFMVNGWLGSLFEGRLSYLSLVRRTNKTQITRRVSRRVNLKTK